MGKNKDIRKKIAGQEEVVRQHQHWIMYGKDTAKPSAILIAKWQKDIARAQRIIKRLRAKLP